MRSPKTKHNRKSILEFKKIHNKQADPFVNKWSLAVLKFPTGLCRRNGINHEVRYTILYPLKVTGGSDGFNYLQIPTNRILSIDVHCFAQS